MSLIPSKILVIQTAFLGDVILTTGILEKLHYTYPKAKIDILIKKGYASLFDQHPFIENVLSFDKKKKISEIKRLINTIKGGKYDTVVNAHKHLSSGIFTIRSGAKNKIGYSNNPMSFLFEKTVHSDINDGRHEYQRLHDLIDHITDSTPQKPILYVEDHKPSGLLNKPYICVAPNSVWFTKTYPYTSWIQFINKIPDNYFVYLVGGPDESVALDKLISDSDRANIINTAGTMTMLESIYTMKYAVMNYTNDSAPLHMASAVNAPVTALFLSTTERLGFGPLSDHMHVLETHHILECKPCGYHGHKKCPKGHFLCADIATEQLIGKIPN